MMKVPIQRFRVPDFYGDSLWHSTTDPDYVLSIKNPFILRVGIDTVVPDSFGSFTKLRSIWLWRHSFSSANSSNFWSSSDANGSNGSAAIGSLGVGVSNNTWYDVSEDSNIIREAYITTGSNASIVKYSLSRINFSSSNDWYFEPSIPSYPSTFSNRAIVARFKQDYIADLPTAMYSVSGRTITWKTNNPVYILLYGQEFMVA